MSKKITPVTAAAQAVEELSARLSTAKAEHAAAVTRCQELRTEGQRINDALSTSGGEGITEDQMINVRQRADAAGALADAKRRGVSQLEAQLSTAQGVLIGEQIKEQAGGYVSWEQLRSEVQAVTAEFVQRLDLIADKTEDRSAFLAQAVRTMHSIDGGAYYGGNQEIGGVLRVQTGHDMILEVDGERIYDMSEQAIFELAANALETAGIPTVRYARQEQAAAAA